MSVAVVVPTVGRPSLTVLLHALASGRGPRPDEVVVVDDRRSGEPCLILPRAAGLPPVRVLRSGGRGPAAARNLGWRCVRAEWVAFLDDDVVPEDDWYERLAADLGDLPAEVGGSQGRVDVPLPADRRPTDWERSTAGLEDAVWITADMAYRREALAAAGGFDERFPRAFREDSDLALRVQAHGYRLVRGRRRVVHPVRPAGLWASVRAQAGNADDVLMRRLHGPDWRERAGSPAGRRPRHLAVTACAVAAPTLLAAGRRRLAGVAAAGWLLGSTELTLARVAPGPRTSDEVLRMAVTSAVLPVAATWHTLHGLVRHRRAAPWRGVPEAVLLDRDGTLVHDVPYNGEPERVRPVEGAREALDRLRRAGVRLGVVTNQSGVARGALTTAQVDAVNARVAELLGPFDTWRVCPHGPDDGCACRKPAPGMVEAACADLGVPPGRCAVVGDIGADVEAATAAGATAVLVPTAVTRPEEVAAAPHRARDLRAAVDLLLAGVR
ncbi:MAG TPA: HAD-IIIA family hydrolase [Jiangellales bacterium]|nr:HAD-IIIA family hydrolase [Jiangellales bacterium]